MVSIVRATTEAECAPVRALAEAHARYERSDTVVPADQATRILDLITTRRLDLFVAQVSGTPVGFATSRTTSERGPRHHARISTPSSWPKATEMLRFSRRLGARQQSKELTVE
jgi:hypothetical protein